MNSVLLLFIVCLACLVAMDAYRDEKTNIQGARIQINPKLTASILDHIPASILFYLE
jgi:hypothetical protein